MDEIPISKIDSSHRYRKCIDGLDELCRSIEEVGLLHPVVLTKSHKLIAGTRRLAAFKQLGRTKIPAMIVSNLDDSALQLKAERDENNCRVDLTLIEAVALGKALEELERPKAKERQKEHGKTAPGKGKNTSENFTEVSGTTREKVGEAIGMSGPTYQRAKAVVAAAEDDPDTFGPIAEEMDRSGKVLPAFNQVQEIKKGKRPVPATNGHGRKPVGVLRANEAIDCLMRIPKNDAHRKRGFQIVTDWIKHNK